jgi:hypothetical protein
MQQERSGAFLVLLSIDIPPVDCRFLLLLFFVFVFAFDLFFVFVCFTFYSFFYRIGVIN